MLLAGNLFSPSISLGELLDSAEQHPPETSFGDDIDKVNARLHDPALTVAEKHQIFMAWASRQQPCLFGRLGAKGQHHIGIDVCWIEDAEIGLGDDYIRLKIQSARHRWKERASLGEAHGFLIMLCGRRLSYLKPGSQLLHICEKISDLYLVEHAPVQRDVIYTEAVPLRRGESVGLFKAGINIFYSSAHRTRNHDRRVPGGLMISVNSPGHWANSLVLRGIESDLGCAVGKVMDIALRSIGNGGQGHMGTLSCSWHNTTENIGELESRLPMPKLPHYVPRNHSQRTYSALYHTDVLVPTEVTLDGRRDVDIAASEHWTHLVLSYVSDEIMPDNHVNYALFHPHPIDSEAMFHNPWPPRRAFNNPLIDC